MTELSEIANKCGTDKGPDCWQYSSDSMAPDLHYGYTEVYDQYFSEIREKAQKENRKVYILEVGVWKGNSLRMYDQYFGHDNVEIYGLDIDIKSDIATDNIHTYVVDQSSREQLEQFVEIANGKGIRFDIIVDDGSHMSSDQLVTLGIFHRIARAGGIYIVEDLHYQTSNYKGNNSDCLTFLMFLMPMPQYLYNADFYELLGKIKDIHTMTIPNMVCSHFNQHACNSSIISFK